MPSPVNLVRNIILALFIVASATGIYYITQTNNQPLTITRIDEIILNSFTVAEEVCVYNNAIYVAGWEYNNESRPVSHACLSKLDYDGEVIWETTWDSHGDTRARKISCNGDGVYIVGEAVDESSQSFKYLAKFGFDGVREWTINGTNIGDICATENYVYVKKDGSLIKLDNNGQVFWETPVSGGKIFVEGNVVYVAGSTSVNATGDSASAVSAFDTEGNQLWSTRRFSTRGDQVSDVCATDEGVYIVGSGTKGWDFFYMTKFSTAGEQLWDKMFDRTVNGSFVGLFSLDDVIYGVGAFNDSPRYFDALTSITDSDGSIMASDVFDWCGNEDYAYNVCSDGDLFFTVGTTVGCPPEVSPPFRRGFILIYELNTS